MDGFQASSPPTVLASGAINAGVREGRFKLILFDLDGTLVDSVPDISRCANEMLNQLDLPERSIDQARKWVGNGVERLVKRSLTNDMDAEPDPVIFQRGLELFNRFYAAHCSELSTVYPDVMEALDRFRACNLKLVCVTNKPEPFSSGLLRDMALMDYFELVVSGNTTARKKPDPMPLHYAAEYFDIRLSACLMVGDSANDVKAARAAGIPIVCVSYGYNHGNDIRESNPDQVVDNLSELADLLI